MLSPEETRSYLQIGGAIALAVPSVLSRFRNVRERKKSGQSWNEALAEGTKLMTGSVWLDGALLLAAALATYAIAELAIVHL